MAAEPAYRRMRKDERRALLVEHATRLFGEHGYDALSMAQIAREARISKALLYHYFPSKRSTSKPRWRPARRSCATAPSPIRARAPAEQLAATLDAFLSLGRGRPRAYAKMLESAGRARDCARRCPGSRRDRGTDLPRLGAADGDAAGDAMPRCSAGCRPSTRRSSTGSSTATTPNTIAGAFAALLHPDAPLAATAHRAVRAAAADAGRRLPRQRRPVRLRRSEQPGAIPPDVPLRATRAGDPAAIKVIRLWSDALRRSQVTRASSFWALPSKVQNDTPVLTLATASDVRAFNGSLPCGSRLVSARGAPRGFTIAVFKLTRRPGANCGSGTGYDARTAILVRGGKIAEWYRLPDDPDAPAPQAPAAPQESNAPII